jgi:hypothetical protein
VKRLFDQKKLVDRITTSEVSGRSLDQTLKNEKILRQDVFVFFRYSVKTKACLEQRVIDPSLEDNKAVYPRHKKVSHQHEIECSNKQNAHKIDV